MQRFWSFVACAGCAGLWISAAFVVAFPEHLFAQNWEALSVDFIHNERNETLLIPFLLLVDVIIAGLLDHINFSKKQGLIVALSAGIYALVVGIASNYIDGNVTFDVHETGNHMVAFLVSLMCLGVVRFVTLLPKPFRKINRMHIQQDVAVEKGKEQ